ncbi:MAG: DUF5630 domain-containing protein [Gammaproteobacteria bacterium]
MWDMPLELLLDVSKIEQKSLEYFNELPRNNKLRSLYIKHLSIRNLQVVFKFSYKDKEFKALCESNELSESWQAQLVKRVGKFAVLQPANISLFSALIGYFLYDRYKRCLGEFNNEITTMGNKLLYEACKTNIFVALRSYLDVFTQQLKKGIFDENELKICLKIAENIAILHLTPGCLEAAHFYLKIGCSTQGKNSPFPMGFDNKIYFIQALANLFMAEKLAETPESVRAFNNAWPEKTFNEVYGHSYKSWENARFSLKDKYCLNLDEYEMARRIATSKLKNYFPQLSPFSNELATENSGQFEQSLSTFSP